jgi:hypothetical protein
MEKGSRTVGDKVTELIFYGNYFYGLCVVAQSIEATLQQRFPLNGAFYFFLIFAATVLYYDYPYARKYTTTGNDPRTAWYVRNYKLVRLNQICITSILVVVLAIFLFRYHDVISNMNRMHWLLVLIFPAVAALYYGINVLSHRYNLRRIGLLKPFIIGFTWSGLVTIYPVLFYNIINGQPYDFTFIGGLLFLKNLMFVSVLCIMFDIKDYATDHISGLNTFVVRIGLRKTIFYILLPLPILGLLTFMSYAVMHQFHLMKILLNMIPFILLLVVGASLRKRRSLMYYLIVIDGLMLVKATCGIIAMVFF